MISRPVENKIMFQFQFVAKNVFGNIGKIKEIVVG